MVKYRHKQIKSLTKTSIKIGNHAKELERLSDVISTVTNWGYNDVDLSPAENQLMFAAIARIDEITTKMVKWNKKLVVKKEKRQ